MKKKWNSALAVSYPARKFGIKRGDSFEAIREKSEGKCVTIHLQVTPVDETLEQQQHAGGPSASLSPNKVATTNNNLGNDEDDKNEELASPESKNRSQQSAAEEGEDEVDASQSAYDEEFNQPKDVREEMYRMEKNRMRSPTEGKACLDRCV